VSAEIRPPKAPEPEVVLSAEHLTKRFGDREAVSDVSFDVHAGEVFGFLGPNGAGKTTTIRMLVGLARPDRGRVRIRGLDLSHDFRRAMGHVGCIVESPDLYRYLTGRENLVHFSRMLEDGAMGRISELAHLVALTERLDDKVSTYSLGMRQRLGIAQALLGNPDVLILDEPASSGGWRRIAASPSSCRATSFRRSSRRATACRSSIGDARWRPVRSASSWTEWPPTACA